MFSDVIEFIEDIPTAIIIRIRSQQKFILPLHIMNTLYHVFTLREKRSRMNADDTAEIMLLKLAADIIAFHFHYVHRVQHRRECIIIVSPPVANNPI